MEVSRAYRGGDGDLEAPDGVLPQLADHFRRLSTSSPSSRTHSIVVPFPMRRAWASARGIETENRPWGGIGDEAVRRCHVGAGGWSGEGRAGKDEIGRGTMDEAVR